MILDARETGMGMNRGKDMNTHGPVAGVPYSAKPDRTSPTLYKPVFPRWTPPGASAATPAGMLPLGGTITTIFPPQKAPPAPAPSRPEPSAQGPSPLLIPRNRPARLTLTPPRRLPDRFVQPRAPHPEPHTSRSRAVRSNIAANSWRGTATSAG